MSENLRAQVRRGLLLVLDEFLRSDPAQLEHLTEFLDRQGIAHPGFVAHNLLDELSFSSLPQPDTDSRN